MILVFMGGEYESYSFCDTVEDYSALQALWEAESKRDIPYEWLEAFEVENDSIVATYDAIYDEPIFRSDWRPDRGHCDA